MVEHRVASQRALAWAVVMGMLAAGCEAETTNDYTCGAGQDDEPAAGGDAGATGGAGQGDASADICLVTPVDDCSAGPTGDACNTPADPGLGSISGEVKAGAMPGGSFEATGDLYLVVASKFDITSCPGDTDAPLPVALTVIHCADLRGGASVPFTIEGVPPRADAYTVIPYLDVNVGATAGAGSLDTCDILALPASVKVEAATAVTLPTPIELGLSGSALQGQCMLPACEG